MSGLSAHRHVGPDYLFRCVFLINAVNIPCVGILHCRRTGMSSPFHIKVYYRSNLNYLLIQRSARRHDGSENGLTCYVLMSA